MLWTVFLALIANDNARQMIENIERLFADSEMKSFSDF